MPHGSEDSNVVDRWAGIIQCTTRFIPHEVSQLRKASEEIHHITKEFRDLKGFHAASVAESEPTRYAAHYEKSILVNIFGLNCSDANLD